MVTRAGSRCLEVGRLWFGLILLLHASLLHAQQSSDSMPQPDAPAEATADTAASTVDVAQQVLACATEAARLAGFRWELGPLGSVLHLWRPHLEAIDANEMDYVRVWIYGRGTAKGLRWEVDAHTLVGRAFISTSVYSPRPPSREAGALRRRIQQECKPAESGS
jgi:hypothetical protein